MTRGALTAFLIANDVAKCLRSRVGSRGALSAADSGSPFRLNAPAGRKEILCG